MLKRKGKRLFVSASEQGYSITRELPYETGMVTALTQFIQPYLCGNYTQVEEKFNTTFPCIVSSLKPYRSITAVRITLRSLDIVCKGIQLIHENTDLTALVADLERQLREAGGRRTMNINIITTLSATANIDRIYFDYVERYGSPVNGIFDAWLLSTIYEEQSGLPSSELTEPLV